MSVRAHQTSSTSQVGVGEHGVFLPHGAEALDGVDELLVVHELLATRTGIHVCFCAVLVPDWVRFTPL